MAPTTRACRRRAWTRTRPRCFHRRPIAPPPPGGPDSRLPPSTRSPLAVTAAMSSPRTFRLLFASPTHTSASPRAACVTFPRAYVCASDARPRATLIPEARRVRARSGGPRRRTGNGPKSSPRTSSTKSATSGAGRTRTTTTGPGRRGRRPRPRRAAPPRSRAGRRLRSRAGRAAASRRAGQAASRLAASRLGGASSGGKDGPWRWRRRRGRRRLVRQRARQGRRMRGIPLSPLAGRVEPAGCWRGGAAAFARWMKAFV
jgi:hypothetical protein